MSSRPCSARSPRPTASRSTTCCRPTRRSTPATPAGRCSTPPGEVIGINSQIETGGSGDGSVGIGFAVPINTAKSELPQLEKGGTVRGAYLGLTSLTIDGSLSALNLPVKSGALVQSVQKRHAGRKGRHQRRRRRRAASKAARSRSAATSSSASTARTITSSEELASDISSKKPGRHGHGRTAARQRQRRLHEDKTRQRDARRAAQLGPEPEHARRLSPRASEASSAEPHPAGAATVGAMPSERHDHKVKICGITQPAGRRAGGRAGRLGAGHDLLRRQPAPLLAERGQRDRRHAAAPGRDVRRVRQRAARARSSRVSEELGLTMVQLHGDEGHRTALRRRAAPARA